MLLVDASRRCLSCPQLWLCLFRDQWLYPFQNYPTTGSSGIYHHPTIDSSGILHIYHNPRTNSSEIMHFITIPHPDGEG